MADRTGAGAGDARRQVVQAVPRSAGQHLSSPTTQTPAFLHTQIAFPGGSTDMDAKGGNGRRRTARRLMAGIALGAAAVVVAAPTASAATTASFIPSQGILSVFGDAQNNSIAISRNAAGQILVNGGAVAVTGGTPTVANTALIQVFGQGGNDTITLNEASGALPA